MSEARPQSAHPITACLEVKAHETHCSKIFLCRRCYILFHNDEIMLCFYFVHLYACLMLGSSTNLITCEISMFTWNGALSNSTCGLVAMTSAPHAEGRQFDPGQMYHYQLQSGSASAKIMLGNSTAMSLLTHLRATSARLGQCTEQQGEDLT